MPTPKAAAGSVHIKLPRSLLVVILMTFERCFPSGTYPAAQKRLLWAGVFLSCCSMTCHVSFQAGNCSQKRETFLAKVELSKSTLYQRPWAAEPQHCQCGHCCAWSLSTTAFEANLAMLELLVECFEEGHRLF